MAPKKAGKTRSAETSTSTAGALRLPRISNGVRPEFYDDPAIDQLFAIVTALTGTGAAPASIVSTCLVWLDPCRSTTAQSAVN